MVTPNGATGAGTLDSPWFPEVEVRLVGEDGNAFAILGRVNAALRRAGVDAETREAYQAEATSGDYNRLLAVTLSWVTAD